MDAIGGKLPVAALAAGTALVAGVMTILMGVVARFPLALAAGLGVNALVAYEIAPEMTWADAMGLVVIEGVIIGILVLTGLRTAVFRAVPTQLKTAIGVGIGLFLMIIGLVDAGFVRRIPDAAGTTVPVELGIGGKLVTWPALVFVRRPAAHAGAVRPQGQGRDPDRHPGHHGVGDHRGGDRQGGPVVRGRQAEPERLVAERAGAAGQDRGPARPVAARQVQRAGLVGPGRLAGRA